MRRTRRSIQEQAQMFLNAAQTDQETAEIYLKENEWVLNHALCKFHEYEYLKRELPAIYEERRPYQRILEPFEDFRYDPTKPVTLDRLVHLVNGEDMPRFDLIVKKSAHVQKWILLSFVDKSADSYNIIKEIFPLLNSNEIFVNNFISMRIFKTDDEMCSLAEIYKVNKFPSIIALDSITNEKLCHFKRLRPLDDFLVNVVDFLAKYDFLTIYPKLENSQNQTPQISPGPHKRNHDSEVNEISPQAFIVKKRKRNEDITVNGLCESLAVKTLNENPPTLQEINNSDEAIVIEDKSSPVEIQLVCKLPDSSRKILKFGKDARIENLKTEIRTMGYDKVCVNTRPNGPSLFNFNNSVKLSDICKNNSLLYVTYMEE